MDKFAIPGKLNNKGMTLIEMLIALMLLLITSLAMMQTSLLAIQTNLVNSLRDEAVSIAELRMNELRNLQFDDLTPTAPTGAAEAPITRNMRAASFSFGLRRTVADINLDTKQVTVTVNWSYKNVPYTHSITTVLRSQS